MLGYQFSSTIPHIFPQVFLYHCTNSLELVLQKIQNQLMDLFTLVDIDICLEEIRVIILLLLMSKYVCNSLPTIPANNNQNL